MRSQARWLRRSAAAAVTALAGTLLAAAPNVAVHAQPASGAATCALGNGISHVVELTFDNVHFFRDNPNVPSDLEQIPALLNFIEGNGTMLSNNHTPLIAHTADDSLTNYTGIYGDRHGDGISNSYLYYPNDTGTAQSASAFTYWTDPISAADPNPNMVYSAQVPAQAIPSAATGVDAATPAPWVPFTRAGCNFGAASTANMVLENTGNDITDVFGAHSPEASQTASDPDSFKDQETADYVGVSLHCGQGAAASLCSGAQAVKFGQTSPSPSAVPDLLPDEPGGYHGFLALDGHKYVVPVLAPARPT